MPIRSMPRPKPGHVNVCEYCEAEWRRATPTRRAAMVKTPAKYNRPYNTCWFCGDLPSETINVSGELTPNRSGTPETGPKGPRVDWRFEGNSTTKILFVTKEGGDFCLWRESYGRPALFEESFSSKGDAITALNQAAGHSHRPNRNLTRFQLERLLNEKGGYSRSEVSAMTDDQLRRHVGHDRLREEGDMVRNGKGVYSGTAAQEDDYVIWQHGTNETYHVDRVGRGGKAITGIGKPVYSLRAAVDEVRKEALRRGYTSGIIFEMRGGEDDLRQIGQVKRGTGMDFEANGRREAADETAARELSLYIENEYSLVGAPNSQGKAIEKTLLQKARAGRFDFKLSEQAWMYLIETGAKKYAKEYGGGEREWSRMFNKPTRELVAFEFAESFAIENNLPRNES